MWIFKKKKNLGTLLEREFVHPMSLNFIPSL